MSIHVPKTACTSCPYRLDTPSGVWHPEEYAKLLSYDEGPERRLTLAPFLCHQTNSTNRETICRGWLSTHRDHVAVRLAVVMGRLDVADIPTGDESSVYHPTGRAACMAGIEDVDHPGSEAQRMMDRLIRTGAGRPAEEGGHA